MKKLVAACVCVMIFLCAVNMRQPAQEDISRSLGMKEFDVIIQATKDAFSSDILSLEGFKSIIQKNMLIEHIGTSEQRMQAYQLIKDNTQQIMNHVDTAIDTLLYDPEFHAVICQVATSAVIGAMPALILMSMRFLSGQSSVDELLAAGEDAALYGAMLEMVKHLSIGWPGEETKDAMIMKAVTQIRTDASFWAVPIAGVSTWLSKEMSSIAFQAIEQRGGIKNIIQQVDWKGFSFGQSADSFANEYRAPLDYLMNKVRFILKNKKTREMVGTVLLTAAEGAIIGALFWSLGIWFVAEGTVMIAMEHAAIRGAVQGLIHHVVSGKTAPGALQNVASGFLVQDLQNKLVLALPHTNLQEIVPVLMKEMTASAVQTAVNQMGGWSAAAETIAVEAKKGVSSRWGWIGGAVKQKFNSALKWLQRDLERGFEGGVL